jgi:hypothetical protein
MSSAESCRQRQRHRMMLRLTADGAAVGLLVLGALNAAFPIIFLGFLVASPATCLHLNGH